MIGSCLWGIGAGITVEGIMKPYVFDVSDNDALPLEYKLNNWQPLRQADLSDFMDNSVFLRLHRTHEGSFEKQLLDILGGEGRVLNQDVSDH